MAIPHESLTEGRVGGHDDGAVLDGVGDEYLSLGPEGSCRRDHRLGHLLVHALLRPLREDIPRQSVGDGEDGGPSPREEGGAGSRGDGRIDERLEVRVDRRAPLRLVERVLHAIPELVDVRRGEGIDQPGHAADVEDGLFPGDGLRQHVARSGCLPNGLGDEADALQPGRKVDSLRHPSLAGVDAELDAAIESWSHVIWVALYLGRQIEQLL